MHDINNSFTYAYSAGTDADFLQAVTTDAISNNVIDLDTTAGIRIVGSHGPYLIIKVGVAFTSTVSIEIQLISSTLAALTGGTSRQIQAWRFLLAQLTPAGKLLVNQQLPVGIYLQYLGLNFNVFTSADAGKFEAFLSDSPETAEAVIDLEMAGS